MSKMCLPYWILSLFLLSNLTVIRAQTLGTAAYRINTVEDLRKFFRYSEDRIPLVCGHRGGAGDGLPENSLITFEHTLNQVPVFFEVDPRMTKDSVVVVFHDATVDRTTTGKGNSDYTYKELQSLFLKDKEGNVTPYKVHTLEEVIQWAKGKTILMLDKKDVPLERLYNIIVDNDAESHVIVSAYTVEEAKFYQDRNRNILFEAFITSEDKIEAYDRAGISWENIVAYVSQPKSKAFYDKLHQRGAMVIVYTGPVYDKIEYADQRQKTYRELINSGVDILLTDRPVEAAQAIKELWPRTSSKESFFADSKVKIK